MHLADIGFLDYQYVQLLADSLQPVYVQKLTAISEALIQCGLLRSCSAYSPDTKRLWFVLETTDSDTAYVAAWIEQHSKPAYLSSRTAYRQFAIHGARTPGPTA
jgi:hypothetical protein